MTKDELLWRRDQLSAALRASFTHHGLSDEGKAYRRPLYQQLDALNRELYILAAERRAASLAEVGEA